MIPAIACIGDSCVDHYEALGQKFPGGNPVNFAVYLRRLGTSASFIVFPAAIPFEPSNRLSG